MHIKNYTHKSNIASIDAMLILNAISKFADSKPNLEFANYGNISAYRQESRNITKDLHHFRTLRSCVVQLLQVNDNGENAKLFLDVIGVAFSQRLTITQKDNMVFEIDYCVGQYYPTEYRKACCANLASFIWNYWRNCEYTAEEMRAKAKKQFGRAIASMYF